MTAPYPTPPRPLARASIFAQAWPIMLGQASIPVVGVVDATVEDDDVRDVIITSQYQRVCHYGIAGLGTAKAFAEALELEDHADRLDEIVGGI